MLRPSDPINTSRMSTPGAASATPLDLSSCAGSGIRLSGVGSTMCAFTSLARTELLAVPSP
eukprot:8824348-Alexandrium_andersonii.AAC.1